MCSRNDQKCFCVCLQKLFPSPVFKFENGHPAQIMTEMPKKRSNLTTYGKPLLLAWLAWEAGLSRAMQKNSSYIDLVTEGWFVNNCKNSTISKPCFCQLLCQQMFNSIRRLNIICKQYLLLNVQFHTVILRHTITNLGPRRMWLGNTE